jgi:8-oxo-dGTP pyrophosphatase MutT (NUDIX family)
MLVLQQVGGWRWWEQPGGDLEDGEDGERAAIRETLEETGLRVEAPQLLRIWSYRNSRGEKIESYAYVAAAPTGDVRISDEHSAYVWMMIDDYVERYCNDGLVQAMPQRADFLLGLRENCALLRAWLLARNDA